MSDRISPPTKSVKKADGVRSGSMHSTITTPSHESFDNAQGKEQKGSLFGKK